ncbi:MAG TPA: ATP-binding protein [Anaerolineales bacterium]|nr:ATP-binding protein [Anaerolineales bacterium]
MQFLATLLDHLGYLNPIPLAGWLIWLGLAGLLILALFNWRHYHPEWNRRLWGIFIVLIFATPATALFLGLEFPTGSALPVPGLPEEPPGSTMMVFSAVPWTLAGGLLGPFAAAGLSMLSGLVRGIWDTHSLFSMLDLGFMGAIFAVAIRQRYRTLLFRLLRQPLVSALCLIPIHLLLFILSAFFTVSTSASVTESLDYALSNAGVVSLAFGGEMLIAGLAAQIVATIFPNRWGGLGMLQPSPSERSIETRFLYGTGTIIGMILLTLLIGDWIIAGAAARNLLRDRLESTARTSAQNVPFFLETGQNLITRFASDPQLTRTEDADLAGFLGERIQSIPYFNQLIVLDLPSNSVTAGYPADSTVQLTQQEEAGLLLIPQGVQNQVYAIPPAAPGEAMRLSFFAVIPETQRALVGRTDLRSNPYIRSLIENLNSLEELNGAGFLIDDQGTILYHPQAEQIMASYGGQRGDQPAFFDETTALGTRQLVYYQPVPGHPWAVVLTIPAQETQQLAIDIALPISLMIILLGLIALILMRVNLRVVTGSLQNLAAEAKHISTGRLDRPLKTDGADEVSELRRAFEQMRVSLKGRLEELNRLLVTSQGVASSLTLGDALRPVLEAVLSSGASSARILLVRDVLPTLVEMPLRFADGLEQDVYMHLDQQILALTEEQGRLVMATLSRTRGLILDPNLPHPESLIAVALRHENRYYGVLWAAYNVQHVFSESDIRFISTLASQAALAVTNIRLFLTVEVSRRQLETILNSTPDPVLVTDASNRLTLANPAAGHILGVTIRRGEKPDIERLIQVKALNELLMASSTERRSAEVNMHDGKTYLAMASPMTADGKVIGRVCILRDVTQLKELDTLKSDFVSTVSHDLRSPLTLMRGYATMLEMAGSLNDQQKNYVKMILHGVENMSKLVGNLLDLGRIDFGVGLQVESIPVLNILERVTGSLQMQAKEKRISLGVEIPRDMPHAIEADQALLHQALYNLVENALKYTPEGGEVTIHLQTSPSALTFAVRDSGIGIPQGDIPRLFEKFYRGTNREALVQRGTGLGLAIVKSIAERHGGTVWVESELGKGSVFYLQIPLAQSKEAQQIP